MKELDQMATVFKPFADEAAVVSVGSLSIENRLDRVSVHGDVDITRDKVGLKLALELKTRIDQIVTALKAEALPERVEVLPPSWVKNPFTPDAP
jgi:hypothetical protein